MSKSVSAILRLKKQKTAIKIGGGRGGENNNSFFGFPGPFYTPFTKGNTKFKYFLPITAFLSLILDYAIHIWVQNSICALSKLR